MKHTAVERADDFRAAIAIIQLHSGKEMPFCLFRRKMPLD